MLIVPLEQGRTDVCCFEEAHDGKMGICGERAVALVGRNKTLCLEHARYAFCVMSLTARRTKTDHAFMTKEEFLSLLVSSNVHSVP